VHGRPDSLGCASCRVLDQASEVSMRSLREQLQRVTADKDRLAVANQRLQQANGSLSAQLSVKQQRLDTLTQEHEVGVT